MIIRSALSVATAFAIVGFTQRALAVPLTAASALEAAQTALATCEKDGYHVAVTVVGADGLVRVVVRGDGATPHTLDSSRAKAYTVATFAPINGLTKTSEIAARVLASPETAQLAHVPGVMFLSGGVAIKSGSEVIGGLGVGGAPGGQLDEACALAGVQRLNERPN